EEDERFSEEPKDRPPQNVVTSRGTNPKPGTTTSNDPGEEEWRHTARDRDYPAHAGEPIGGPVFKGAPRPGGGVVGDAADSDRLFPGVRARIGLDPTPPRPYNNPVTATRMLPSRRRSSPMAMDASRSVRDDFEQMFGRHAANLAGVR